MLNPAQVQEGLERLSLFFSSTGTRQGILARRALGAPARDDDVLTRSLVEQMGQEALGENHAPGAAVPIIWRAHELLDLGCGTDHPTGSRVLAEVLALQGKPGAFSHGCSRTRHAHRVCEHFISGFFSPAPPEQRLAPVMLPNGKVFRAEPAARFAVSCLALRAALRGRFANRAAIERHFVSLIQLSEQWNQWNGYFAGDAIVAGIHALACGSSVRANILDRLSSVIAAQQAVDGSWPGADLFATLEALLALRTREAHAAVRRAVPAVLSRQRLDGSFGSTAQQERALIALRALIWSEQEH